MGSTSNRERLEIIIEIQSRKARTDFMTFRKIVNPGMKWGWWQYEITAHLQRFYDDWYSGMRPKLVIEAPPQHGKSSIITEFIAWAIGRDPDKRIIYASFSDRLGVRANLRLRRMMQAERYKRIFPAASITGKMTESLLEFGEQEGSFRNTTVRGAVTGEGLDLGVVDDPLKGRAEARSKTVRESTWDWFTDDFFSRFSEDAALLIILTRWHLEDPVGRLIAHDPTVKVLKYKAIATEDEPHRAKGEPLFPEHKSLAFLLERKKIMASGNWLALYQQSPTAEEGEVFEPGQIQIVDAVPAGVRKRVRGWDFGASTKGDYTVGVLLGSLNDGRYIVLDVVRLQAKSHKRDEAIKNTAKRDGFSVKQSIPRDPGAAGVAQVEYLTTQLAGNRVVNSPETGDKVTRAEPFASQVNVGNVLMLRAEWNAAFVDEMRYFPDGAHDDQIDAASRAFNDLFQGTSIFDNV